ncbi:MAG: tetratricopeptide repeat protein [Candidatus Longimicrobiales bacterium M2_2A_002]
MTDRSRRIRVLFERALALPPAERSRWLEWAAGDDPGVVEEVKALLAADGEPTPVLDATPAELLDAVRPPPGEPRDRHMVGPYRIIRELGRGGMGAVYLAEREDVGLRVALKILRPGVGLASPDHVRRFLLERRLLARLDHPLIARLLDGGVMPDGTEWLAMELVDGEPITHLCDRVRMGIRARLRLFEAVCDAVSYAHRNLVVHRDLKPGNILVTESDGEWRPKLLDFGIAKLLNEDRDGDPVTRTGHRPLTPEYAAPEQLAGGAVATATDVYALGVLLYELLAGNRPPVPDPARPLAPPRPSVAATRRGEWNGAEGRDPAAVAAARGTSPQGLRRLLAGDLDNIVMKALEADPGRRYESAAALRADLRRYREERPVVARAATAGYRARKFVARNRAGVVAAGLVLASVLAGLGTATWQAAEASRARQRAEGALAASEQVRAFLADMFNGGNRNDVWSTTVTLGELLEQGLRESDQLRDQPVIQAEVLEEIGQVYLNRGEYDRAEEVFRRVLALREAAIGPAAPATATALRHLGDAVRRRLGYDEAEALYRRALAIRSRTVGESHPEYADVLVGLASLATLRGDLASALSIYERAFRIRRSALGPEHPLVAESLRLLAVTRRRLGNYPRATALYTEALERRARIHGTDSPEAAYAMVHLADQYYPHNGDPAAAEPLYEEALRILRARLGSGHPALLHPLHSLASLREGMGELEAAEELWLEAREIVRRNYGDRNWRMAAELDILGTHYRKRGDYGRAEAMHRRALAVYEQLYPPAHRYPLSSRSNLVRLYLARGEYAKAEAGARFNLELMEAAEGPASVMVALERELLGEALFRQGKRSEAESQLREALAILDRQRSDDHQTVRRLLSQLVELHDAQGNSAAADRYRARLADPSVRVGG